MSRYRRLAGRSDSQHRQGVHAEQMGVSLLPSGMLMPRKTVAGMIGLNIADGGCSTCGGSCGGCAMAGHCGE